MEEGDNHGLGRHGRAEAKQHWLQPLPPRIPPFNDNSSFVETTRLEPDDEQLVDSMTEEEHVRAHLQDVESSFIPPTSPTIQVAGPDAGIDDTYLFDAARKHPAQEQEQQAEEEERLEDGKGRPQQTSRATSPEVPISTTPELPDTNEESTRETPMIATTDTAEPHTTAAHASSEPMPTVPAPPAHPGTSFLHESQADCTLADDTDTTDATFALESLSSPTTAAAARAASRAASAAANTTAHEVSSEFEDGVALTQDNSKMGDVRDDGDGPSSVDAHNPDYSGSDMATSAVSTDAGAALGDTSSVSPRPRYLHSRNGSHRSSSSFLTTSDDVESDVTVGMGADYALHSGGAAPAFGLTRTTSRELSRSISIGSMASGVDDSLDPLRHGPLEPLQEVDSPVQERAADTLVTPKPKRGPLKPPTDTAIARHVRNVEVPESLAQHYQAKGGLLTPVPPYPKPSDFASAPNTTARGGRSMTLKEQSSTIDRLSKENFDLKLKVMFLSDRLDKLSEEGIKEMISENVELRTTLAVLQRDNKVLRRRAKDLEKRLRDEEDRPSTARSGFSSDGRVTPSSESGAQTHEEELILLREQIEEYVREIERLRSDNMAGELEKRKLLETVMAIGDKTVDRAGDPLGRQEEADVWKDLLEQETARREQTDEENRVLREEVFQLRQETNGSAALGGSTMHHTTNIYNITRKPRQTSPSRSRPLSGLSGEADQTNTFSQSSTLVDELRRESEKLRHENAELRREVGAQTSMLTSRNREKERLYQEIEELKLAQRRGGPAPSTIDSILDRSASRIGANDRPISRGSGPSRLTMAVEDPEREELENKIAEQRDKFNELKFKNQELQREVETYMADLEDTMEGKRQAEEHIAAIQDELENTMNDLMAIQSERDEALEEQAIWENKFADLREEAQTLVNELESEIDQHTEEIHRLQLDLQDRSENFEALQEEMRRMTESLIKLEDEQVKTQKRSEQLEQELAESGKELEDLEAQLLEANEKGQRLGVQQESCQAEISFLREEQESDKIRIGDLEAAVANAEQIIAEERDRVKELDQRLTDERKQRELTAAREKEEAQQVVNDLNREASSAKEEARLLRKSLGNREVEATQWKERLMELENNLREALGDLNGTRSSLLQSIAALQRELETTVRELDSTKSSLLEKERMIKQRDSLLETHALESRKLGDLLEKERQAHRITKNQFETFERTHQHVSRTVTSQDSRIVELETTRASDKRRISQLEATFKEQLAERNNLLLVLWTRLSMLCGSDWAHDNSLINGRALPSVESIATMLPGFSKNLLAAVKMIESLISNFQSRIKSVERDLWKEYQALENAMGTRTKKIERLEALVRAGAVSGNSDAQARLSQLEGAYRALKIENATLQRARDARTRSMGYSERTPTNKLSSQGSSEDLVETISPSPSVPTGPGPGPYGRESRLPRSVTSHLEATTSKSTTSSTSRNSSNTGAVDIGRGSSPHGDAGPTRGSDQHQWFLRLRELESKLKEEREARMMDRAAARQRIQDSERQNSELAAELIRAKRKAE